MVVPVDHPLLLMDDAPGDPIGAVITPGPRGTGTCGPVKKGLGISGQIPSGNDGVAEDDDPLPILGLGPKGPGEFFLDPFLVRMVPDPGQDQQVLGLPRPFLDRVGNVAPVNGPALADQVP